MRFVSFVNSSVFLSSGDHPGFLKAEIAGTTVLQLKYDRWGWYGTPANSVRKRRLNFFGLLVGGHFIFTGN
jgi:hypothetical protein